MKKLIPILFVVAVLAACQKEPSLSKLDDDYVVFTDYDKSADFGEYLTYYMPDSVLLITNNEKATYWTNEDADYILETFADNMAARGFTLVDSKEDADLGLQVSYIEDVRYFVDYPNDYCCGRRCQRPAHAGNCRPWNRFPCKAQSSCQCQAIHQHHWFGRGTLLLRFQGFIH